jgi:type III secretion protein N (ATPase)
LVKAWLEHWQSAHLARLSSVSAVRISGRVSGVRGILLECRLPAAKIGDLCEVDKADGSRLLAEIVGFTPDCTLLSALGTPDGVQLGAAVHPLGIAHRVSVDAGLLGAVLDGFGRSLTDATAGAFAGVHERHSSLPVIAEALPPTQRPRISRPLPCGIRAIDSAILLGQGQFGLIGERGRELREFLDHELDAQLRSRSVLVCATSDRSSMERARAAFTATAIAEAFRAQGKQVLLLLDSLTRFARAQREIGIACGEPLGRGGLPPSVYSLLPRLVERAGLSENGSITALYTVLIEQDSMNDPVADEVRSLLDGHIVLSRQLAERGHYPAIDVSASISRIMNAISSPAQQQANNRLRQLLAAYKQVEMLLRLGEYHPGADPFTDHAVSLNQRINAFLRQDLRQPVALQQCLEELQQLTAPAEQ